jgi:inner membrane protein
MRVSKFSFVFKAIVVAAISVLLLVPLMMINGTIGERQTYREQAVESVGRSYAGPQSVIGPVLVIPYSEIEQVTRKDRNDNDVVTTERVPHTWYFYPKTMVVTGKVVPSERKLGLYSVRVYELQSRIVTAFKDTIPSDVAGTRVLGQPYLSIVLADVRGVAGNPTLRIGGRPVPLEQGNGGHRKEAGLHVALAPVTAGQSLAMDVDMSLSLGGTETLSIAPIADSNRIDLNSTWQHPHFDGSFLPRKSHIDGGGFTAHWDVSSLAASTQAQYTDGKQTGEIESIGLGLVEPVNVYSQIDRASKYGFLFVMLTFVGFFMFELIKRLAIHPIQYGLVGLALAIFFLLLLSLSEHYDFWIAYLSASVACIGLLGVYLSSVLRSVMRGASFAAMLTLLYAALYGLLVSEDNALVLGSLMLFAILAVIMLVTRKVDWYALGSSGIAPPPIPARPAAASPTAGAL